MSTLVILFKDRQNSKNVPMVRYSLSSEEHEIKRGLRKIQTEIKQGIFVDIPMDFEHIFDEEFYVKLSNCKTTGDDNVIEINGTQIELENAEVNIHEYDDSKELFYLSSSELKEIIDKFSYTLANDLRHIILAVLPTSVRKSSLDDYVTNQYKFF